jgi:Zn-dependent M32 family carboxypeptidase
VQRFDTQDVQQINKQLLRVLQKVNVAFAWGRSDGEMHPWIPGCIAVDIRADVRAAIEKAEEVTE